MAESEALKTLNCGIGMVLVVDPAAADAVAGVLEEAGETVYGIGLLTGDDRPGVHYIGSLG
jgi:phosphoribosylformylglycinamidine cyclo-ligase